MEQHQAGTRRESEHASVVKSHNYNKKGDRIRPIPLKLTASKPY